MEFQHKVALGVLFVVPILIALPPRKIDPYTFGLGIAWVFCLNEVTKYHGTTLLDSLRQEQKASLSDKEAVAELAKGWKGECVYGQHREREEEGKGIGEMIMESCWDVWQQRDKRRLTPEQEAEEDLPLAERVKKFEREARERKEREAVEELARHI